MASPATCSKLRLNAGAPVDPNCRLKALSKFTPLEVPISSCVRAFASSAAFAAPSAHAYIGPGAGFAVMSSFLVILVTMVYGPIAAMLVELFPTRIRYSGLSLPYHIGNGWFGGLLPTTAFAIVAQTGNMYNGLWYPIIIAGATFIIGMLFVRETKDVDIYAND